MQLADSEQNVAFLYDPIFVESGEKSYAIYWCRPDTNKALKQEILQHKEGDSVFHTFTYPLKEVGSIHRDCRKLTSSIVVAEGVVLYWSPSMVGCRFIGRFVAT